MSDLSANQPDFSVDGAAAQASQMLGQPPAEPVQEQPPGAPPAAEGEPQGEPTAAELSEWAQALLDDVSDEHKPIVQQYMDRWDAGVTRRLDQVAQFYNPVNEVLDQGFEVEELATAAQFYDLMMSNPEAAMNIWQTVVGQGQGQPPVAAPQPTGQPAAGTPAGAPAGQQPQQFTLPPELEQKLNTTTTFMEQMALREQQREAQATQQAEDQALDQFFTTLHRELGDFDDEFVTYRMYMGDTPEDAVAAFRQISGGGNGGAAPPQQQSQALPPVPVLHGGSAGGGPKPITDATPAEVRATITKMLNDANAQAS